ncbi:MAG: prolipoprotein diacylglyceryl transferase [Desulfobulbaceae bacterium]|nr:prolipoprotein diacylglyceryl transferase [Desulfobulbaceae bacterium]
MNEWFFLLTAAGLFTLLIVLGWRLLPGERYQVLASVPVARRSGSQWRGINFTAYGALTASAVTIAVLFVLILAVAAHTDPAPMVLLLALIVGLCLPAARLVARLVEKKQYTFTIGGSFFCGLAATPLLILLVNGGCLLLNVPLLNMQVTLAALGIGYILGEGLGRLACISFGCCYGKPLHQCGALATRLFNRLAFVFTGATKKAVYEGGLAGVKLVPVQGLTCLLYTATALLACHLFFQGHYRTAFLLSLLVSQIWRVLSEMLRADFRGFTSISAYQKMSLAAIVYGCGLCLLPSSSPLPLPAIAAGMRLLLNPMLLLGLQLLWFGLFFVFGRSMVTEATLSFTVRQDRI